MDILSLLPSLLLPAALFCVFLASLPTGFEILRLGNEADPLRREIEPESRGEPTRDGGPPAFL